MALDIRIRTNAPALSAMLSNLARRQLPFAGSRALNATAWDATLGARKDLERRFDLRNKRGNRGITIRRMAKRDWPRKGPKIAWREYLAQHQRGGKIKPEGGARAFAIPTRPVAARRTKSGKLPKRYRPREAYAKGKVHTETHPGGGRIVKNPPKRGRTRGFRIFHLLRRSVRLKAVLHGPETVRAIVKRVYSGHLKRELRKAIQTARR